MPKDDDPQGQLVAERITVLEADLERFTKMMANLQERPDSDGYRYAAGRVEEIVAELEKLRAPEVDDEPEGPGMPTHGKFALGAIGAAVAAVGGGGWFLGVVAAGLAAAAYVSWKTDPAAE